MSGRIAFWILTGLALSGAGARPVTQDVDAVAEIRGLTLPIQISGQAIGPIVSGFMFDSSGSYHLPFFIFGAGVVIAAVGVLAATPPQKQQG